MAELQCVFFPDILAYIIAINFAEVEWRSIFAKLRATAVNMSTRVKRVRDITLRQEPITMGLQLLQ